MKKNASILIAAIFSIFCFSTIAHAGFWGGGGGQPGLPKTGQTTEYQTGDDGTYKAGLPLSGARFIDNGDGTISDVVTSLQWIKQPELIIPGASIRADNQIQAAKSTWANDTAYSAADLVTDSADSTFWICAVAHTSLAGSSGTWATSTSYTAGVVVTDGDDSSIWLCASSHTSASSGTFSDDRTANPSYWSSYDPSFSADRTAHPTYWRQTVWTSSAAGLTSPSSMDWSTSITNCEGLEYAGHSDWRLPNIEELMSIVDYEHSSPAIDTSFFPNMQSNYYWSGSSYAPYSYYAWYVNFYGGSVGSVGKYSSSYVLPVRSSQ